MFGNFGKAWAFTAPEEGIHSNDPQDPGGDTKWGTARNKHPEITDEQWANWTEEDSMHLAEVSYWDACRCDDLTTPVDIITFDTAYNMGVSKALALLIQAMNRPGDDAIELLFFRLHDYSEQIRLKPERLKYFRGWINRVVDLFFATES
jgi:lysozyme family protein